MIGAHIMNRYERHYNRVHRRWLRLKPKLYPCACGGEVGLNESLIPQLKKYYCECETCHWTTPKAMTIRGAICKWNRDYLKSVK